MSVVGRFVVGNEDDIVVGGICVFVFKKEDFVDIVFM